MADAASDKPYDKEYQTDLKVGDILRRTRVHYDQSIEYVERCLNIKASQIEAIENGDLEKLPGRVYAIGFVRSYAEHLGLDGDKMVELFKVQADVNKAQPTELHFPAPASDNQVPGALILIFCSALALGGLFYWYSQDQKDRADIIDVPPVPASLQQKVEESPVTTATEEAAQEKEDAIAEAEAETAEEDVIEEKPPEGIILNIRENSWVEIRDKSGKAMLSRVLKAGDQYYVPDRPDLTISIGNAGGVEVEVDGQQLRPLGEKGKVVRRLSLDAEYLKENFALETEQ